MSDDKLTEDLPKKQCSKCKEFSPATPKYFSRNKRSRDGLHCWCKVCDNASSREYGRTHREKISTHNKAKYAADPEYYKKRTSTWRLNNPEKKREMDHNYYLNNIDSRREYYQEWYAENIEHIKISAHDYYIENGESIRQRTNAYAATHKEQRRARYKEDPDKHLVWAHDYRARKNGATISDLSAAQVLEIKQHFKFRCQYCGKKTKKLTVDHIDPLVDGGNNTLSNVTVCCFSCNAKKKDGPILAPVQPLLLTIAKPKRPYKPRKKRNVS
jgi:HNH endonuclease